MYRQTAFDSVMMTVFAAVGIAAACALTCGVVLVTYYLNCAIMTVGGLLLARLWRRAHFWRPMSPGWAHGVRICAMLGSLALFAPVWLFVVTPTNLRPGVLAVAWPSLVLCLVPTVLGCALRGRLVLAGVAGGLAGTRRSCQLAPNHEALRRAEDGAYFQHFRESPPAWQAYDMQHGLVIGGRRSRERRS